MIFVFILAVIVPLLAVPGGAWLLQQITPGTQTALNNPDILWAQGALAAAPLVALLVFSLLGRWRYGAVNATALLAAVLTLGVWAWYHMGAPGVAPEGLGMAMLVSPIPIGMLTFFGYCFFARTSANAYSDHS